eukprot:11158180-Lingulodinium_polyedra.AAC.1
MERGRTTRDGARTSTTSLCGGRARAQRSGTASPARCGRRGALRRPPTGAWTRQRTDISATRQLCAAGCARAAAASRPTP